MNEVQISHLHKALEVCYEHENIHLKSSKLDLNCDNFKPGKDIMQHR